jgi:hypothetical protein
MTISTFHSSLLIYSMSASPTSAEIHESVTCKFTEPVLNPSIIHAKYTYMYIYYLLLLKAAHIYKYTGSITEKEGACVLLCWTSQYHIVSVFIFQTQTALGIQQEHRSQQKKDI